MSCCPTSAYLNISGDDDCGSDGCLQPESRIEIRATLALTPHHGHHTTALRYNMTLLTGLA